MLIFVDVRAFDQGNFCRAEFARFDVNRLKSEIFGFLYSLIYTVVRYTFRQNFVIFLPIYSKVLRQ